jgi:hypothetical protein
MNIYGKFFILLSVESTTFLLYQLSNDISVGWFAAPSVGEMLILIVLATLAGIFYLLTFNYFRLCSLGKINNNYLTQEQKKGIIAGICLIILGIIVILNIPINGETPVFIHLIQKNDVIAIYICFILFEILIMFLYDTAPGVKYILNETGKFIDKNAIWLIFIAIVFIKVIILYPISRGLFNLNDAFDYWKMADQIFHGSLDIAQYHKYPPLYPMLLSPVFLFGPIYSLQNISLINSIISSTAIFPLYLLARKHLPRWVGLIMVLLFATYPFHIVFPGIPYSENLYYPLFYWVLYFALTNTRKTMLNWVWDALFAITLTALWLTRYMTLALIPVFLVIWLLKPDNGNSNTGLHFTKSKLIKLFLISLFIITVFGIWVIRGFNAGIDIKSMIGFSSAETGDPNTFTFTRLIFWGVISSAYSILLAAPVLHILILALFSPKNLMWKTETKRMILAVTMIATMLMITVTIYSWQASYNYPEPGKFVGRYIIYIAALAWLTAAVILKEKIDFNRPRIIISSIIAFALVFISYQIFMNHNWIIKNSIINIRFIDVFSITLLQWIYLLVVIGSLLLSTFLLIRNKLVETFLVVAVCILYINVISLPFYFDKIESEVTRVRNLDALLSSAMKQTKTIKNFVLYVSDGYNFYPKELQARGYKNEEFEIKRLQNETFINNNCKFFMLIVFGGQGIAVVKPSEECNVSMEETLSSYEYNEVEYSVVKTNGDWNNK